MDTTDGVGMVSHSEAFGSCAGPMDAAARAGLADAEALRSLARIATGAGLDPAAPAGLVGCASGLNNDGSPLQLCLSCDERAVRPRLIGEPGAWRKGGRARLAAAKEGLALLLPRHDSEAMAGPFAMLLRSVLPSDLERLDAAYRHGVAWIGGAPEGPGVALYVEAKPPGESTAATWARAREWLAAALAESAPALTLLDQLCDRTVPASFAIEGRSLADARAKLYLRPDPPGPLSDLGVDLLIGADVMTFLTEAMGGFGLDADGLLICLGFSLANGALIDVKIDLCGHCLAYPPEGWTRLVDELCRRYGLAAPPMRPILADGRTEVAFIGFARRRDGRQRLNLYLKPTAGPQSYREALERGIGYLCRAQGADGAWRDYALPVGASDQWITAYAGLALAEVACRLSGPMAAQAHDAAARAADWLSDTRPYPAGWGYNGVTGPDTDSTAFAVALLDRLGRPVRAEEREFLLHQWRSEGGFSTYDGTDAWAQAHPCVTPLAFAGLAPGPCAERRRALLSYLDHSRQADGLWPGYWWRRPYYASLCVLDELYRLGEIGPWLAGLPRIDWLAEPDAFTRACIAGIEQHCGAPDSRLWPIAGSLLAMQGPDGRWPGHPNLRVTDDQCWRPWDQAEGELYEDTEGILTTATVIAILARLLEGSPGRAMDGPAIDFEREFGA